MQILIKKNLKGKKLSELFNYIFTKARFFKLYVTLQSPINIDIINKCKEEILAFFFKLQKEGRELFAHKNPQMLKNLKMARVNIEDEDSVNNYFETIYSNGVTTAETIVEINKRFTKLQSNKQNPLITFPNLMATLLRVDYTCLINNEVYPNIHEVYSFALNQENKDFLLTMNKMYDVLYLPNNTDFLGNLALCDEQFKPLLVISDKHQYAALNIENDDYEAFKALKIRHFILG